MSILAGPRFHSQKHRHSTGKSLSTPLLQTKNVGSRERLAGRGWPAEVQISIFNVLVSVKLESHFFFSPKSEFTC